MTVPQAQGLLFVYGECGPNVTESEFNEWYDGEHAPARLTVPGILSAARYKANDGETPTWLAVYDLANPEVTKTEAYTSLRAKASENEQSIISRLAILNRRIYALLFDISRPGVEPTQSPKFLHIVTMRVAADAEAEFNRWYEEEHIPLLSKGPGWLRSRRYKLVDHTELAGGKNTGHGLKPAMTYLAVHSWDRDGFRETPEFKASISTPWVVEIMKQVLDVGSRVFTVHKTFEKPQ